MVKRNAQQSYGNEKAKMKEFTKVSYQEHS